MAFPGGAPRDRDRPASEPEEDAAKGSEDDISPRAREIKQEIENGTYEVDLDRLADRLEEELIRDEPEGEPEPS